ncbi:uncharacterized protein VTP21DRAFT_2789 [Calcarisporiella thermophila]|uniref:uncharacterized protein n=1 Tax=Calcarisporiella thermophila TaxID=911321 RepID=UPI003743CC2C
MYFKTLIVTALLSTLALSAPVQKRQEAPADLSSMIHQAVHAIREATPDPNAHSPLAFAKATNNDTNPTAPDTPAAASTDGKGPVGETLSAFKGDGTFYDVGLGACGSTNSNSDMVAALNAPQFGSGNNGAPSCGKKVEVSGPKGKVTVTVVDKCPGCAHGDLDLSPAAFQKIADQAQGRVPISWQWA